ncbi:transketolase [Parascardovia denticolens DSM 10105 = JCM 12538]|uniref:Transketolase n=1 Tax=Parascardovia denticolens DSM 10105 = JCM 12538 TaxID=864564 RepID=E6JYD2_PARDN|nr:transketolase [Parascardovia denticolens]EFG33377.1 transketolase [Parascardovia denticolens F0305]EFT83809.1 transketolase [Parascardovia denticolens DSM 10105 = JCM 12538]BAR05336.1 transketolase [Parascardovia denticolens DSM 10105 = JCM 12538]
MVDFNELDGRAIKNAKVLAADAVEKAGSGHPGSPISLAPIAYTLYQKFMKHDPNDPKWEGRDRFILSGGHASLTQYIQLFYSGYGLTLDDLEHFRTMDSITPGHPEYGLTPGIEVTTGPLGQGVATAVGFAYGQRFQRNLLDPEAPAGESPFDHKIWVICGEGDVEEGVSSEASSLAGNQELGNLTVIFDANHIQIEGDTKISFAEDVLERYKAYGWYTDEFSFIQPDGSYKEDVEGFAKVLEKAEQVTDRPKFIKVDTLIAWPTPGKTNNESAHGSKLGAEAVAGLKEALGFDPAKSFEIDEEALAHAREVAQRGLEAHKEWDQKYEAWKKANPAKAALHDRIHEGRLPEEFDKAIDELEASFEVGSSVATRKASGAVINALAPVMPELWGGSADLGGSNNTVIKGADSFAPAKFATSTWPDVSEGGRIIHFGVREFAMGAITNGILLDSDTRVFNGTFFQFADYERPAVRLAALMNVPNVYVWTHDSVALGEDGPTHQPIEHLASMRAIPQLDVVRPADQFETAEAYRYTFEKEDSHPTALILTRQGVPTLAETKEKAKDGVRRGAYVLVDTEGKPDVIIMATGSEVQHAVKAAATLAEEGVKARVVSFPSMEWFEAQDEEYKESVLPTDVQARVSIEAGLAMPWYKYLGSYGKAISIEQFGLQGDGQENMRVLGITPEHVVDAAKASIEAARR